MVWIVGGLITIFIVAVVLRFLSADEIPEEAGKKFNKAIVILGIITTLCMFAPFTIVSPGHKGVIVQLGAVKPGVLKEGIHFRIPIIQSIKMVDCRIRKEEVKASAASKDLQQISSKIAVNYRVNGNMAAKLYQNVGDAYPQTIIAPAIQESMKSVTAKYTAEELITKRQDVSTEVKAILDKKVEPYGIIVDNFNIVNFDFSKGFNEAIEQKQTAEQLALKARRDLERIKIEAEQKVANAKAEAESLKVQRQEVTPELLQLRQIEVQQNMVKKWNGQVPYYLVIGSESGGPMPFLPLNGVK